MTVRDSGFLSNGTRVFAVQDNEQGGSVPQCRPFCKIKNENDVTLAQNMLFAVLHGKKHVPQLLHQRHGGTKELR